MRSWLIGVSLACFGAGLAVGLAIPVVTSWFSSGEDVTRERRYVRELVGRYGLDREQARMALMVLEQQRIERERLVLDDLKSLPESVQRKINEADGRAQARIGAIMSEKQRRQYLADSDLNSMVPVSATDGGDSETDGSSNPDRTPETGKE